MPGGGRTLAQRAAGEIGGGAGGPGYARGGVTIDDNFKGFLRIFYLLDGLP